MVDPLETIVIKDSVSYTNLFVGKEYTISGVLMNKATNAPIYKMAKKSQVPWPLLQTKSMAQKTLNLWLMLVF